MPRSPGRNQIGLAFCWAHVRRKFYELADTSPVATEVLRRVALLYAIEDELRGFSAEQRRAVRHDRSRIIVDDLRQYLEARNRQVSAKSKLGEAIRYALTRWDGLSRVLDDGRIDLDSNIVERSIRPLALNRKNALFAGSDEGGDNWAVIATLIENCKLSGINPHIWLTDTLARLANGIPQTPSANSCPGPPWPENTAYHRGCRPTACEARQLPVEVGRHAGPPMGLEIGRGRHGGHAQFRAQRQDDHVKPDDRPDAPRHRTARPRCRPSHCRSAVRG
jgi:hypothetical protein